MKLKDRVAIVTGGGYGIGKAYSFALADEGAKVVAADINFEGAQEVAREIEKQGKEAISVLSGVLFTLRGQAIPEPIAGGPSVAAVLLSVTVVSTKRVWPSTTTPPLRPTPRSSTGVSP